MDTRGNAAARSEVAAIKVAAMEVAHNVVNRAVQTFGAAGVSEDTVLARLFAITRALQIADGPNEVHLRTIGNLELAGYRHMTGLDGRVALVTGATRGLGYAIALGLAEAGATVVVSSRKADACEAAAETIAKATGVRRRAAAAARRALGQHRARHRRGRTPTSAVSTSLVNNAGIAPLSPSLADVSEGLFDKTIEVNLKGPFRLMAVAGRADGRGRWRLDHQHLQHRRGAAESTRGDVRRLEERPQRAHHGVRPGVRPARAGQLRDARRVRHRHGRRTGTTSSSARSSTGCRPAGWAAPTRWSAWSCTWPATPRATRPGRSSPSTAAGRRSTDGARSSST